MPRRAGHARRARRGAGADIPGDPVLAAFAHDEPIFAIDTVQHIGQVIGLVVADTVMQARAPHARSSWTSKPLPAVLTCATRWPGAELRAAARARAAAATPGRAGAAPHR
jgi:xanthine dehydrogenase large subunit